MKAIVLVDGDWGIGKNGDQVVYVPSDLKYFREMTMGHPVILGRKTLATFPGGRPLKGRQNLILSRDPTFSPEGAVVFSCVEDLLSAAHEDAFVIGGSSVYRALLDYCDIAYVTMVHKTFQADCYFPNLNFMQEWCIVEESRQQEENGLQFHRVTYRKKYI